jgi:hypothetical protein
MRAPTEATRFGRNAFDADDRNAPGVGRQRRKHLGCQHLLDLRSEGSLADAGRPQNENQRIRRHFMNRIQQGFARANEAWVRHCVCMEVLDARRPWFVQ